MQCSTAQQWDMSKYDPDTALEISAWVWVALRAVAIGDEEPCPIVCPHAARGTGDPSCKTAAAAFRAERGRQQPEEQWLCPKVRLVFKRRAGFLGLQNFPLPPLTKDPPVCKAVGLPDCAKSQNL